MRKSKFMKILSVVTIIAVIVFAGVFLSVAVFSGNGGEPEVVYIEVMREWNTIYAEGEEFFPCRLAVTYDNGLMDRVDITPDMLSGFDTSSTGTKEVTVTYGGRSVKKHMTVARPATDSELEIVAMASVYYNGETIPNAAAYAIYNGEKVELTPDMVSVLGRAPWCVETIRILVNDVFATKEITFVSRPSGEYTPETPSVIDERRFLDVVWLVMNEIGLVDEYASFTSDRETIDRIIMYLEAAGLTDVEIQEIAAITLRNDSALALSILDAVKLDPSAYNSRTEYLLALSDALVTEESVDSAIRLLKYLNDSVAEGDYINILKCLIDDLYERGIIQTYDTYIDMINSAEVAYICCVIKFYGQFYEHYNIYPEDDVKSAALFLRDAFKALATGDIAGLILSGSLSYEGIVDNIEFIAMLFGEISSFIDNTRFIKAAAEVLRMIWDPSDSDPETAYTAYMTVTGIAALCDVTSDVLENITLEFTTETFNDYAEYLRADESEKEEKFAVLAVKLVNFVSEKYQMLSEEQTIAVSYAFRELFGAEWDMFDLMENRVIKDISTYTPEELIADAALIKEAFDSFPRLPAEG